MVPIHPQYIIDENQNRKAVVLSWDDWERIMDELEELDDIRTYDAAKVGPQDSIPFEQAVKIIRQMREMRFQGERSERLPVRSSRFSVLEQPEG